MNAKNKHIRQIGFARRLHKRIAKKRPELAEILSEKVLNFIIIELFEELSDCLRNGYRVIFEDYFSFFRKPIERQVTDMHKKNEKWMTYKNRIRIKPLPKIKSEVETDLTPEEREELIEINRKKKEE